MQDNILPLIGRTAPLFEKDISENEAFLTETIRNSHFLVIGGAGTIGSAICRELFARNPKVLKFGTTPGRTGAHPDPGTDH